MILGDVIERNAQCYADHPAVLFEGRSITHAEFYRRVKKLVNALAALGHRSQDRLAVLSRNCPEYLEVYGAASLGGFVGLGLNYRLSAKEQAGILVDAQPAVFFFEQEYAERAQELRQHLPGNVDFVCLDGAVAGALDYETLVPEALKARWRFAQKRTTRYC